jgi:cellulose synthase/poly-beta-1,6-N-acetylglucosamine synthase-like glycosyltransferase
VVAGLLGILAARRALFLVAAAWPMRSVEEGPDDQPTVLVVLAARNEQRGIARALEALDRTDYPRGRLHIALVDDGSTDATPELLRAFANTRRYVGVVSRDGAPKKASALNEAIAASPPCELVVVCDADQAPAPDCFRRLAGAFREPQVGAAAAYLRPVNAGASMVARYTAVETWVHQLVTSAAKDRLGLDPPMLGGGSMYRREALDEIGGFPERAYAEDLGSSLLLARAGWRTRFVPEALVDNLVAAGWRDYWDQHLRWTRSLYQAAEPAARSSHLSVRRRVEQALQTAGYLDRIVLGGGLLLAASGRMRPALPGGYVAVAAAEVVVAAMKAGVGHRRLPGFLLATAVVFPLDAAGTLAATLNHLARRPLDWRSPRRTT